MAALIDANKNEERVEGDGSERIGGHSVSVAGAALNGDDGNTRSELGERVPEVGGGQRSGRHIRSFRR